MSKTKSAKNLALAKWELFSFAFALAVYFFYMKSSNKIINYPSIVLYSTFFCLCLVVALIYFKRNSSQIKIPGKDWFSRMLFIGLNFIKIVVFSWILTGILLIPFNYYNIYVANESKIIIEPVEIEQLVARARNNSVFFRFKGRMNVIYGHKPIMNIIYNKQDINKYYLVLNMNKGLFGSYVLNSWDILVN